MLSLSCGTGWSFSSTTRICTPIVATPARQRRGFGEAVDLHEVPAELRLEPLDECGGRRRAGDGKARRRADVVLGLVGIVENRAQNRRRHAREGDLLLLDQL